MQSGLGDRLIAQGVPWPHTHTYVCVLAFVAVSGSLLYIIIPCVLTRPRHLGKGVEL